MRSALLIPALMCGASVHAQERKRDGWVNNETRKTRYDDFEFKNCYPAGDTAAGLLEIQTLNRAIEVYTTQMMRVSEIALGEGRSWFPIFRFYSPSAAYFDKTWVLNDIEAAAAP